jgi:signal transduction histidine kinase
MNRLLVIPFIFLFILHSASECYAGNHVRTVAVFFPFNANMPSYQNFMDGFRSDLSAGSEEPCNLMVEYFDIMRSTDEEYVKHMVAMYNEKLKGTQIDLLVTIPPYTYSLLKKHGLEVLEKTPTIKIELDPAIDEPLPSVGNGNTVEIKIKFRIEETLKNAFALFPKFSEVYILSGNSGTDSYFASLVLRSTPAFKTTHHFNFISGIPADSLIQMARKIPSNSIVIIPVYLSDRKNSSFSTPEVISIISNVCKAPVFPIFDSFLRTRGGIGGFVFSYLYLGKETGRIALALLEGSPAGKIKVNESCFYQHIYDWRQLKRWNLVESEMIPKNSIFYHKEPDFFSEYKWYILAVLLFLILESVLVLYLITLNKRQKKLAKQKTETENLYRQLVREDRLSTMVELTASLSHELNQPLTAILYSAQAGKRFLESEKLDQEQAKEIFNNIIEDDKRAAGLISSVRSLMKLETREKEKVNLDSLIQDTISIFHSEAINKKIKITCEMPHDPLYVFGDKIQLQQVLLNFLTNAAIALENMDPEHRTIDIHLVREKSMVAVSVRDSGPGIDASISENLFKPFVTTRVSGFGIGLAVSRSIIEKHLGEIRAFNVPGGGAEFSFRLPVIKEDMSP